MRQGFEQIAATGLRVGALGTRFIIVLLVARLLEPAQSGQFILYYTGIQLASSLLTLDIYASVTRKILSRSGSPTALVGLHIGAIGLASLTLGPLALLLYYSYGNASFALLILFLPQTLLELVANDLGRLLVPLGRPFATALLTFLRSALWIVGLGIAVLIADGEAELGDFVASWLVSALLCVGMALYLARGALDAFPVPRVNLRWIADILAASAVFLLGTLMFRAVMGVDRFIIQEMLGLEAVAVYGTFAAIAFSQQSILETGVSAWFFPKMLRQVAAGEKDEVRRTFRSFFMQNTIFAVATTVAMLPLVYIATHLLLPSLYADNMTTFYIISVGTLAYCVSAPFYYLVYSFGADFSRFFTFGCGAAVLCIAAFLLLPEAGLPGAGAALALALGAIAVIRIVDAVRLMRRWDGSAREDPAP